MSISRYRNIQGIKSNYLPQQFIPDFEKYAGILGNQQNLYDEALAVRDIVPKHLSVDRADVNAYTGEIQSKVDSLADLYNTQGVSAGNRTRSELLRNVRRDWQPGGKAYGFQQNYSAYQDYIKNLDEAHKAGKINSDKRDQLAQKSLQVFGKSYNDDVYKDFSGITAAEDVDLAKQADELAKGWAESKVRAGEYTIKGGQYFDMRTNEYVDPQEIYDNVFPQLMADAKNSAYFNQEGLLSGNNPQQIGESLANQATTFAANKYGYSKDSSQYLSNWALRESMKHKNKLKELDHENAFNAGTEETVAYTVNSGLPPLKFKNGNLDLGEGKKVPGFLGITLMNKAIASGGKDIGPLEDFANTPEAQKEYPGLSQMLEMPQFQRRRGKEGDPDWVESNEEYNKRVSAGWESKRNALSTATGKFSEYNDEQQARADKQIFGTATAPGSIVHKTIWVQSPGMESKPMTYQELMKQTGYNSIEELNKGTNILGTLQADNNINPSGYQGLVKSKNGKDVFNVVIGRTSIQHSNYNKPVFDLMSVGHDGSKLESNIVTWQPSESLPPQHLKSKAEDIWNGEEFVGRRVRLYEIKPDEGLQYAGTDSQGRVLLTDGTQIISDDSKYKEVPSDVSPEELINANEMMNPYLPTRMNKRLKNE